MSTTQHIRLEGANCPELNTPDGVAAKQFVIEAIGDNQVIVTTRKNPIRSFARYVATVTLHDGTDLAQLLIDNGHAVAEEG